MQRLTWLAFALFVFGGAGSFWALKPLLTYKPMLPSDVPRGTTRAELKQILAAKREEKAPQQRSLSKVEAPTTQFDFGMMDPDQTMKHEFVVRNVGTEILRLGDPKPGCVCATGLLSSYEIEPGEQGTIAMEWNPSDKTGPFSVSMNVPTSDPEQPVLHFSAKGIVRRRLDAAPSVLSWGDLAPDSQFAARQSLLYSEVWEQFAIEKVECSLTGATWSFEPVAAAQLPPGAKAGYRLTVNIPSDVPSGPFHESLQLWIRAAGEPQPLPYTMHLDGHMRGRISIYGSAIDELGLIDLGTFATHQSKRVRLVVKVRDADKNLANPRFEVEPAFVQATLTEQGVATGLYALDIVIPQRSPAGAYLRPDQWGALTLLSDHPRIPERKMRLRFAITGREAIAAP